MYDLEYGYLPRSLTMGIVRLHIEPNVILTSSKVEDVILDRLDPAAKANESDDEQRKLKLFKWSYEVLLAE